MKRDGLQMLVMFERNFDRLTLLSLKTKVPRRELEKFCDSGEITKESRQLLLDGINHPEWGGEIEI